MKRIPLRIQREALLFIRELLQCRNNDSSSRDWKLDHAESVNESDVDSERLRKLVQALDDLSGERWLRQPWRPDLRSWLSIAEIHRMKDDRLEPSGLEPRHGDHALPPKVLAE